MPTYTSQYMGTAATSGVMYGEMYSPNDWSHMAYIDYEASEAIATLKERLDILEAQMRNIEHFITEARERESWEMIDEFIESFKLHKESSDA